VLMCDHPLLVNFAEANGRAPHSSFAEREPGSPINSGAVGGLWARTKVS